MRNTSAMLPDLSALNDPEFASQTQEGNPDAFRIIMQQAEPERKELNALKGAAFDKTISRMRLAIISKSMAPPRRRNTRRKQ